MKLKKLNKKGQAESIIIFFVLIIAVLIVSIIILRIVNSILTPLSQVLNNTNVQAGTAVSNIQGKFTGVWDWVIIIVLLLNIVILLVSAFLVDIHPAFIIIYIIAGIFLFIFGNFGLQALDSIWGAVGTSTETSQTPLEQFIINNFQLLMLGVYVLSGILMYAKIKFFGGQGTGGNY